MVNNTVIACMVTDGDHTYHGIELLGQYVVHVKLTLYADYTSIKKYASPNKRFSSHQTRVL